MKLSPQALSLTFVRVALGVIALVHGIANTFGVWGGPGVEAVAGDVAKQVAGDSGALTTAVSVTQLLLGLLLVLGPFARIAAMVVLGLLAVHFVGSERWQTFFVRDNGFEFLLAVAALCAVVIAHGPGPFTVKLQPRGRKKQKE